MVKTMSRADALDALAGRLGPRGYTDAADAMAPTLVDWRGRVRGRAAALLAPADTAEVADVVRIARAARLPIVPQGGNTSTVAGATPGTAGDALVLSLRRMAAIRAVSAEDASLTAEAGAILSDVHRAALEHRLRFPLSLAAKGSATIGGLVSTNAGGTQVLRFGTMRSLLLGIEAVLPDGTRLEALSPLRKDNRGYDLRQLLCGAEGTLGIVTAATLRLVPAPAQRAVAWIGLASPGAALRLLRLLEAATGEAVETFELVPEAGLDLVLRHIAQARPPLAGRHRWHVLVEASSASRTAPLAAALAEALAGDAADPIVEDAVIAGSERQADALVALREALPEAERLDGMAAKHDIAVPVSSMPRFIERVSPEVEARFAGARVLAFGHLGDGNIHFNVRAPAGADDRAWVEENGPSVSRFVHDAVIAEAGTISAEHGIGQTRLEEFARLVDPARLAVLRAIKSALDPYGIMNPGKLVPLAPAGREAGS